MRRVVFLGALAFGLGGCNLLFGLGDAVEREGVGGAGSSSTSGSTTSTADSSSSGETSSSDASSSSSSSGAGGAGGQAPCPEGQTLQLEREYEDDFQEFFEGGYWTSEDSADLTSFSLAAGDGTGGAGGGPHYALRAETPPIGFAVLRTVAPWTLEVGDVVEFAVQSRVPFGDVYGAVLGIYDAEIPSSGARMSLAMPQGAAFADNAREVTVTVAVEAPLSLRVAGETDGTDLFDVDDLVVRVWRCAQ